MTPTRKIIALAALAGGILLTAIITFVTVYSITKNPGSLMIQERAGYHANVIFLVMTPFLVALIAMMVCEARKIGTGWIVPILTTAIGGFATSGAGFVATFSFPGVSRLFPGIGFFFLALAASIALFFVVEFLLLRLLSLTRLGAIARITYYEALLQPFTLIVLGLGVACVAVFAFVPFFTQSEDAKVFRDVGMSFCFIFTLPVMIFASSKVIDEEIENRTMLTLMSKPVTRWQVVLGKYFGVLNLCLVVMMIMGIAVCASAYVRYVDDMRIDYIVADNAGRLDLDVQNTRAILALIPSLILKFLQISTLAAVAVAISTRYSLALNITIITLLYLLANLTQFVDGLGLSQPWQSIAVWGSNLLPHLNIFDIDQRLIYGAYSMPSDYTSRIMDSPNAASEMEYLSRIPAWSQIWQYVGGCAAYALIYIGAALSAAIALFRTRELS